MSEISSYYAVENMQEPISMGFLRNVLLYPANDVLFINEKRYTYQQLWTLVDEIYNQLNAHKQYEAIGIYCNDDVNTYASILAVNLYGAAYVPLNKKFPVERNRNCIEECGLQLILSAVENTDVKEIANGIDVIYTNQQSISSRAFQQKKYKIVHQPISYILFTSGSTGEPKGVPVSHSNVNHFFNFFLSNYNFNEKDTFLQVYELTFDVSVFSFFMPLLVGACCYVLPDDGIKFLKTMDYLKKHNITVVSMVPTVLRFIAPYLNEISLPRLRYSFFSGDALQHNLAVKWSKALTNGEVHNFYGPTETTIVCTRYIFEEKKSTIESINGIVPLGKAFEGMEFLIVDENNIPTDKGELCFTGTQVIASYLNTKHENGFFIHNDKRYYKTGDISSLNEYGNLVFYGRTDSQVKINGYRIELKEIENAISKIENVNCKVVCKPSENGVNTLTAFIESKTIEKKTLKEKLYTLLPDYMIPQNFVAVENFILNTNGKVDAKQFENHIR